MSIIFASSGVAWFAAANGIAMAANPGICESKSMVSAILSPVEPPNKTRSPITSEIAQVVSQGEDFELLKTVPHNAWVAALGQGREQGGQGKKGELGEQTPRINPGASNKGILNLAASRLDSIFSDSLQINSGALDHFTGFALTEGLRQDPQLFKKLGCPQTLSPSAPPVPSALFGHPIATLITKERLTETLRLSFDRHYGKQEGVAAVRFLRHDVEPLLPAKVIPPYTPANVEVLPPFKGNFKPTENPKNVELPKGESQLKVQLTFPLPSPEHQPILTVEKLAPPRSDGNSELGTLRMRKLEFFPRQTGTDSELGTLRVRELELLPRQADTASELGTLRVRELGVPHQAQADPELGTLRVRELEVEPLATDSDLELGNLRIREQESLPPQKVQSPRYQTTAHLIAQSGYFQTNNIFSGIDPVDDSLLSLGLTLVAVPALGPKTTLVTAIDGALIRYLNQSESNYNQLRVRAGIRQQLTPRMYGEIGWNNQQLFRDRIGDRFLNEHSLRLAFQRRDQLTDKLRLNTLYEFRLSDANPESRSRIINSLLVSLSYSLKPDLQVGLDYQFALSNFTQRERQDQYQRLLGRLTYALSRDSQISVQSGLTFGGSSQSNIDFDNLFFSVTYIIELGKF